MGELDLEIGEPVEHAAIHDAQRRHRQREFPAQHPAKIVGIHPVPADYLGQRMDKDIDAAVGHRLPERIERRIVERQILYFRSDRHTGKAQLVDAARQLRLHLGDIQHRHMGKTDKTAAMVLFRLFHLVVDKGAGRPVGIVEPVGAGQHRHIDARIIHHPHMFIEIRQQRIEQIGRVAVLIKAGAELAGHALGVGQFLWCVVMLEIDNDGHGCAYSASGPSRNLLGLRKVASSRQPSGDQASCVLPAGRQAYWPVPQVPS